MHAHACTSDDVVIQGVLHLGEGLGPRGPVGDQLPGTNQRTTQVSRYIATPLHRHGQHRRGTEGESVYLGDHGVVVDADVTSFVDAAVHAHLQADRKRDHA